MKNCDILTMEIIKEINAIQLDICNSEAAAEKSLYEHYLWCIEEITGCDVKRISHDVNRANINAVNADSFIKKLEELKLACEEESEKNDDTDT